MFSETTISYVKIGNHPIETTIYKWMFQVPGIYIYLSTGLNCHQTFRCYLQWRNPCPDDEPKMDTAYGWVGVFPPLQQAPEIR